MTKNFLDVFPKYEPKGDLKDIFEDVEVLKISRDSKWTRMIIHIKSSHLIPFSSILEMEDELKANLSQWKKIDLKIVPHFALSDQYTAKSLYDMYKKSIEDELKFTSRIDYYLYRKSKITFPDERIMMLKIPKGVVKDEKSKELTGALKHIIAEKCGVDVEIRQEFYLPEKKEHENEPALEMSVAKDNENIPPTSNEEEAPSNDKKSPSDDKEALSDDNELTPRQKYRSKHPDVLYGKDFQEDCIISISEITGDIENIVIKGEIFDIEEITTRRGDKVIFTISVTDYTDSINLKIFSKVHEADDVRPYLTGGKTILVKGNASYSDYDREVVFDRIYGIKEILPFRKERMDEAPEKRVELHCHTKMSNLDAVSDVTDIIAQAKKWGHKALAITDHGVVQAFTDAYHMVGRDPDFKVIYGCEGYLVNDLENIAKHSKNQSLKDSYVVFDIETTGFSAKKNKIIEIGAVKVENGIIVDEFSTFVNPKTPIPYSIEKLTGIRDVDVSDADTIDHILPKFMEFCKGSSLVAHNASFDTSFIRVNCENLDIPYDFTEVDTVGMSRLVLQRLKRFKLDQVAKELKIPLEGHHRAVNDARCTAQIFIELCKRLDKQGVYTLDEMNRAAHMSDDSIKKLYSYHVIILAKNEIGRINLYRLVSESHLKYFNSRPLIPKSLLEKYREGLIIGSACEAGELYRKIVNNRPYDEVTETASFYDYLEIQPVGNNAFLLKEEGNGIDTVEDLQEINKKIVSIGEKLEKPVVATCDVHFLNPEDEIYRRIIMAGQKFKDADEQPPLYLHTTQEMLDEFSYLGYEKAYEVVVKNTNMIADMCDVISPVRPDKCPPVIENSDVELRHLCYEKAKSMYGDPLPALVTERLERELNSIISNGFAVMYIIAQRLVKHSNDDGYLVGSRGSVGSSFVATMSGITEVNPLPPHYYCTSCHYVDFDSDEVKAHAGGAGCDLPDKPCPVCGKKLLKDGFDIPFETFLGFKGNKEPDIDLNFSGEYQSQAHAYTEVIFGKGQTFRAGTIGTLAEKNAFGFVKNYFEDRGIKKRKCEMNRLLKGCVGVRRTTGQHPGGIIVLPHGESIYSFTPIQHPANKDVDIITTHFDYHSIDHNLLKLDILGHDDPTMIKMLEDETDIDAKEIPLDDREVMSLFKSPEALGVSAKDINVSTGSLGVPEFGTKFVIGMLEDTKPSTFADLVRISGLSHGTNVWLDNAQTLILAGKATISTAICTRDDIMSYLIGKGMESELSFTIMENVRKGKGLTGEFEEEMKKNGVPDWYIWSCNRISYMFPKAHAAAYVMMAWRIAWFKINYPLQYYAAYFSIRAKKKFDYEIMTMGKDRLSYHMEDFKRRSDNKELSQAEEGTMDAMQNVYEMYQRGFEFAPIDIYEAKSTRFRVIEGKLMPSLDTIPGLGESVAVNIETAAKEGPFLSMDDFRKRAKVGNSMTDKLKELGILVGLPETNQISLFDMV